MSHGVNLNKGYGRTHRNPPLCHRRDERMRDTKAGIRRSVTGENEGDQGRNPPLCHRRDERIRDTKAGIHRSVTEEMRE